MKRILVFSVILMISLSVRAQYDEPGFTKLVNEGAFGIEIGDVVTEHKKMLNEVAPEELWWQPNRMNETPIHSTYVLNLKKAKATEFFGFKVQRVEILAGGNWWDFDIEEKDNRIFEIAILLETMEREQYTGPFDDLMAHYGRFLDALAILGVGDRGTQMFQWMSDRTILMVGGWDQPLEMHGHEYFPIIFRVGYGGEWD